MFGSKKSIGDEKSGSASTSGALNSLVAGCVVEGNVYCESDIRLDGTILGNLTCKGKVIIGASGKLVGEIRCDNAVIEGRVEGLLVVEDQLTLKETAEVIADVRCGSLAVVAGAIFNATCRMGDAATAATQNGNAKVKA